LASTPALRAALAALREVVFAALRACCWRPRACPPFLAAALRFVALPERDEADELRLRELAERLLADRLLPPDLLLAERLPEERLDPPAFFAPLDFLDPPLLLRSAICFPPTFRQPGEGLFPRMRDYLTS
jgi:hypothetical protein